MGEKVVGRLIGSDLSISGGIKDIGVDVRDTSVVSHFPFRGDSGFFDVEGGFQTKEDVCVGTNLAEILGWRDPSNWRFDSGSVTQLMWDDSKQAMRFTNSCYAWLKIPIVVDTTKHYRVSADIMFEERVGSGTFYMGGFMTNASGQSVTVNYDYSMCSSYTPASLNTWHNFKYTRFGTTNHTNSTRTSYDSVCGWMGTKTSITDTLCKYWYFGGLWNYALTSGIMYLKNLKIEIYEPKISKLNNVEGLVLTETTNNMFVNSDFSGGTSGWTFSSWTSSNYKYFTKDVMGPYGRTKCLRVERLLSGGSADFHQGRLGSIIENSKYILSAYVRGRGNITLNSHWSQSKTFTLSDDWQYVHFVFVAGASGYLWYSLNSMETYCEICMCQLESKMYPSFYSNGSRGNNGVVTIDDINLTTFSIGFKFRPQAEYHRYMTSAYNRTLITLYDKTTSKYIDYNDYVPTTGLSVVNSNPFFDLEPNADWTSGGTTHMHHSYDYVVGKSYDIYFVNSGNTLRIYVGCDGVVLRDTTFTNTLLSSFVLNKIVIGRNVSSLWQGIVSDLTIYNKALSSDELKSKIVKKFTLDNNGDVYTSLVEGLDLGNGKDGDLSITSDSSIGVYSYITTSCLKGSTQVVVDSVDGLVSGDEVLIHQTQDGISSMCNGFGDGWVVENHGGRTISNIYEGFVDYGDSYKDTIAQFTGIVDGDTAISIKNSNFINVIAGKTYCFSVLAKCTGSFSIQNGTTGWMSTIEWYGTDGSIVSGAVSIVNNSLSSEWRRVYIYGVAPTSAVRCKIRIGIDQPNFSVGQKVWVTSPMFHEGSVPSTYKPNHGRYEFNRIKSISGTTITFNKPLDRDYSSGVYDTTYSSVTQVVKVMNYNNITINSGKVLRPQVWNGKKGGILVLRIRGDLVNNGLIDSSGVGFRGGRAYGIDGYTQVSGDGECGEGYLGRGRGGFYSGVTPVVKDSGGICYVNGCGGSYGTKGGKGSAYGGYQAMEGLTCGDPSLIRLYFGGGGAGGHNNGGTPQGGRGGGIVMLFCNDVIGSIQCNGQDGFYGTKGAWGAGGGAGGSIYIECCVNALSTQVSGGSGLNGTRADGLGGSGGSGRVYINEYSGKHTFSSLDTNNIGMRSVDGCVVVGSVRENL